LSYLFIDSTYDLSLGVLDDGLNWLSFENFGGSLKASAIIQARTYELLNRHQIIPKNLKGVIIVNGPGFYTGLRLAEGFADVFSFFGVKHYSFYSYEIPKWCGFESGTWFTKAYRGEYFYYHWHQETSGQELLPLKDLESGLKHPQIFIHSPASLDTVCSGLIKNPIETTELLKKHPEKIFREVVGQGLRRESFYFRAPEDEFKANP
jgi:tRNA threonylcarbamoyladenosine biosynthesis protein TsaB